MSSELEEPELRQAMADSLLRERWDAEGRCRRGVKIVRSVRETGDVEADSDGVMQQELMEGSGVVDEEWSRTDLCHI